MKKKTNKQNKFMRTSKTYWTKKSWRETAKSMYFIKGGKDKGKLDGSWKLFNGKYFSRLNFKVRNDKVNKTKKYWKDLNYSVRTKKDGKFTSIFVRPNFEKKKK